MIEHSTIKGGASIKAETHILPVYNAAGGCEDYYQFFSYRICIRSNEREISQIFKGLYACYYTETPLTDSIVLTVHKKNRNVSVNKQTPCLSSTPPEAAVAGHQINPHQQRGHPFYIVSAAGKVVFRGSNPVEALTFLEWFVANALVQKNFMYMMFHAAALSCNGTGVIFPSSSGSGKTTISLALIAHGFQYLSDEVAIVDAEDLIIHPLPRGLAIQEKALHLLQSLKKPPPSMGFYLPDSPAHFLYFNPTAFIHQAAEKPVPVRRVVFLEKPLVSTKTHLKKIPKAMAVSRLLGCSFVNSPLSERNIANCIRLSQMTECYALTGDNLQERVDAVLDLFHIAAKPQPKRV